MSSYIVEEQTIQRIVTGLTRCAYGQMNLMFTESKINEALMNIGFDLRDEVDADNELGTALLMMNQEAVNSRYSKQETQILLYKHKDLASSDIQLLKSIECYLYQCSEGDVPETPLFRIITTFGNALQSKIVSHLPEYESATWG